MPSHCCLQMLRELEACGLGADQVDPLWEAYQASACCFRMLGLVAEWSSASPVTELLGNVS